MIVDAYNNLANVLDQLELYDQALSYHEKSLQKALLIGLEK